MILFAISSLHHSNSSLRSSASFARGSSGNEDVFISPDEEAPLQGGGEEDAAAQQQMSAEERRRGMADNSQSSSTANRISESLRGMFFSGGRENVNYDRESFLIRSEAGWGAVERFFHNYWAPFVTRNKFIIVILTLLLVAASAVTSFFVVKAADKAPSFFPPTHNIGMLELVNSEYVSSTAVNVEKADAVAWGLIEEDENGGGATDDLDFCPEVDGEVSFLGTR